MQWGMRVRAKQIKYLLRSAAEELLPEAFSARRSLAADQAIGRALSVQANRIATMMRNPMIAELGLVELSQFQRSDCRRPTGCEQGAANDHHGVVARAVLQSMLSGDGRRLRHRHLRGESAAALVCGSSARCARP